MKTVHVGMAILPIEPQYPHLNSHPTRVLTISGTQPSSIPVQLVAYYATSRPANGESGFESCYRTGFIGPINMLHISDPLKIEHDGSHYKATVIVDKYEPGKCRWQLSLVLYKIPNGIDAKIHAGDSTWYGTPTVFLIDDAPSSPNKGLSALRGGRIDIWCAKQPRAEDPQSAESCGALAGVSRNDYRALIPPDQRGDRVQTEVFPEDQSAEVNFHDLDALHQESEIHH
jgi:hypothetical protein